jgi:hypothetical protein
MSEPSLRKVDLCEADFLIASCGGIAERNAQHFRKARRSTGGCLTNIPLKMRGFFENLYLHSAISPISHCPATIREVLFDTKGENKLSHEGPNGQ